MNKEWYCLALFRKWNWKKLGRDQHMWSDHSQEDSSQEVDWNWRSFLPHSCGKPGRPCLGICLWLPINGDSAYSFLHKLSKIAVVDVSHRKHMVSQVASILCSAVMSESSCNMCRTAHSCPVPASQPFSPLTSFSRGADIHTTFYGSTPVRELSLYLDGPFQYTRFSSQVWKVLWSARPCLGDQSKSGTNLH